MISLVGGCRVFAPEDGVISLHRNWTERAVIQRSSGAKRITQTIHRYEPGQSPAFVNPAAEEVLYVAAGEGVCHINGFPYPVRPGSAVYVPPGAICDLLNSGPEPMRIVSSCCPEDAGRQAGAAQPEAAPPEPGAGPAPRLIIHEDEREDIKAGENRIFRYLVHTDLGCRQVTQFVGWIPTSKAPFHLHTYEEAIYILEGRGLLHLEREPHPTEFGPGSSIYLPAGVVHCLENREAAPMRLLGVFYPSGSPGAAYED